MRILQLHAPIRPVKRSEGRSATKVAAYISGTYIHDLRTGDDHDYKNRQRKNEIEHSALLLPDNAPDWAHRRKDLWNRAEMREKRKDSQTGRTLIVALPAEFTGAQRKKAAQQIGQWFVERYGLATDMAIHRPDKRGDQRNYHLHMLVAGRRFADDNAKDAKDGDGWAAKKDCALDDRFGKGQGEVREMRQHIADTLNDISARGNLNVYVEHLSFKDQGLDREATQHMGQVATQKERIGQKTDIGTKNRRIVKRNTVREERERRKKIIDLEISRRGAAPPPFDTVAFYSDTVRRRKEMLQNLDRTYGQQEEVLRQEMAQTYRALDVRGLKGWWRKVSGKSAEEQKRLAALQESFDRIRQERQNAAKDFESARQARRTELQSDRPVIPAEERNLSNRPKDPFAREAGNQEAEKQQGKAQESILDKTSVEDRRQKDIAEMKRDLEKHRDRGRHI